MSVSLSFRCCLSHIFFRTLGESSQWMNDEAPGRFPQTYWSRCFSFILLMSIAQETMQEIWILQVLIDTLTMGLAAAKSGWQMQRAQGGSCTAGSMAHMCFFRVSLSKPSGLHLVSEEEELSRRGVLSTARMCLGIKKKSYLQSRHITIGSQMEMKLAF